MAERTLTIRIRAEDNSGPAFDNLNRKMEQTKQSAQQVGLSGGQALGGIGRFGLVAAGAYDRVTLAALTVENAEIRVLTTQNRLNMAIDRYGAGSKEATKVTRELETAQKNLNAQQERYWIRIAFAAGSLIPELITGFKALGTVLRGTTVAKLQATAATLALTRAQLLLIGTATLGVGALVGFGVGQYLASQVPGDPDLNVYGDINVGGVENPSSFARQVGTQTTVQFQRGGRP